MQLQTLQLFCEIARHQSFSQGANELGITQSAASQAIAHLEKELEVNLINRGTRPLSLTTEGELYLKGVKALLSDLEKLSESIRLRTPQISGIVNVASIYSVGLHAMNSHLHEFKKIHPHAKVRLEYHRPNLVIESILSENCDIGIISFPQATRVLDVIPLRSEKLVLACHPNHPLANKENITIRDLDGQSFVTYDQDLNVRRAIDREFRKAKVRQKICMEFDNVEVIKQAVEEDAGLAILPLPTLKRSAEHGTIIIKHVHGLDIDRPIGIIHKRNHNLTPTAQAFIELLKSK